VQEKGAIGAKEQNDKTLRLVNYGLNFCRKYDHLVRYNPELCGDCEYNDFRINIPPP
jgi:hypothetical protein